MSIDLTSAVVRYSLAGVAACLAMGAGVQTWRLHSARADAAECHAGRLADRMNAQQLFDAAVAAAKKEEASWNAKLMETTNHANEQLLRAHVDAALLGADVGRLRDAARAAARGCAGAQDTHAAPGSPAAADPGLVLSDVLGEVVQRATDMAAEADKRGIAGSACERAYRTVTGD